tara:strand:+ start:6078 stop:6392 length:315 start_codon:yes stop_codon:yes gene_type:complete
MNTVKKGEIVYADIKLISINNVEYELKKVVFSRQWECDFPVLNKDKYSRFLRQNRIVDKKNNIIESKIVDIQIIAHTGFKNNAKGYTEAKKNEQIRDSVTGAYV